MYIEGLTDVEYIYISMNCGRFLLSVQSAKFISVFYTFDSILISLNFHGRKDTSAKHLKHDNKSDRAKR